MMRHRVDCQGQNNSVDEDSSDDDDDAFTALSRKKRKGELTSKDTMSKKPSIDNDTTQRMAPPEVDNINGTIPKQPMVVVTQTSSSAKRHHGEVSDARKAKMDAILLELEAETSNRFSNPMETSHGNNHQHRSRCYNSNMEEQQQQQQQQHRTGGSYVDPGDEEITTNIFVGNLAPSITEEQMTELFRQFGENYFFMLRALLFSPL
jgi:hypothetical protein